MTEYNYLNAERVGDAITEEIISQWNPGEIKIINAAMGKGKTYFVENILCGYAKQHSQKCLMLTPRRVLKEQVRNRSNGKVTVLTYQTIEYRMQEAIRSNIKAVKDIVDWLNQFRYIICDEFHYWLSDASFNLLLQYSFDLVINRAQVATKVMLSATCQDIESYFDVNGIQYTAYRFDTSYHIAQSITFFKRPDNIYEYIRNGIKSGVKTIVFREHAKDANSLYEWCVGEGYSAQLVTASRQYRYNTDKAKEKYLVNSERFEDSVLITTRKLECGINIKDKSVKQIIIDVFDIVAAIQCIGRKRAVSDTDKVNLFICVPQGQQIGGNIVHLRDVLQRISDFKANPFSYINQHNREMNWTADGIIYPVSRIEVIGYDGELQYHDYQINSLKLFQYEKIGERIQEIQQKNYPKVFLQYLHTDVPASIEDDNKRIEEYLYSLCGEKDFYIIDGRKKREEFIKELNIRKNRKLVKGKSSINSYFENEGIFFRLDVYDARPVGGSRYSWKLIRL